MCRWDDGDYDWYVDSESTILADVDIYCEDCGRIVRAGERVVRFTASPPMDDERPYVFIVPVPPARYYGDGNPWLAILPDDEVIHDTFDALGFRIDEEHDPRMPVEQEPDHFSCVQCRAANYWLEQVCHQHHILVTVEDLIEHTHDYTSEQLGPDFMTLATLARQQWVTKGYGVLMSEQVVRRLARGAVQHAVVTGLHP